MKLDAVIVRWLGAGESVTVVNRLTRRAITLQGSDTTFPEVTMDVSALGIAAKAGQMENVGVIFPGEGSSIRITGVALELAGVSPKAAAQAGGPAIRSGPDDPRHRQGNVPDAAILPIRIATEKVRQLPYRDAVCPMENDHSPKFFTQVMKTHKKFSKFNAAFTMVELLVVIAIIAVLASLLFSLASRMRTKASSAISTSNLRQIGTAIVSLHL